MQSLIPRDDEPIQPIQPPQPQQAPQAAPPQGYNYPPPNYPPPNYPPPRLSNPSYPPPAMRRSLSRSRSDNPAAAHAGRIDLKVWVLMGAVVALIAASGYLYYQLSEVRAQVSETKEALLAEIEKIHETSSVTVANQPPQYRGHAEGRGKISSRQAAQLSRRSESRSHQARRRSGRQTRKGADRAG